MFGLAAGLVLWPTFGLAFGLGAGLEAGLAAGLAVGLWFGLTAGLVFGLMSGLFAGLTSGSDRPQWAPYMLTRGWLAIDHRLPWSLMTFLADAHQRGVLRQAGAVYQFRHIDLQHRLATRP